MREVAFVRSPVAHARLTDVRIPERLRSRVFTAGDLTGVRPIRAVSPLPGFQASEQWPLATDKLRHVGELIAMCVADTRAEAEDIAAEVVVEYEELPAVVDMLEAQRPGCVLVHDTIKGNVFLEVGFDGPIEAGCAHRAGESHARVAHRPPGHVADRMPRLRRAMGRAAAPVGPARRHPVSACGPHRTFAGAGTARDPDPRHLARCRRRLRIQGDPGGGRNLPVLAGDALRPSGPLARGSARAADRERELPRTSLRAFGLYGRGGKDIGVRSQGGGRFRRLFGLSVHRRDRALPGQRDPARPLRDPGLPLQDRGGGHQQMPAASVPRRRPAERLLCHGADDRRDRPPRRPGALRGAPRQPGPPRADALRQRHRQAFRQRRLSAAVADGGRSHRPSRRSGRGSGRRSRTAV